MRVGLTGGVASGKSTVAARLRALGAVVIDYDVLAREVVARGSRGLTQVTAEFGPEVLTASGELDRPHVARLVFGDPTARKRLEAIVHPLMNQQAELAEASARSRIAPGESVVVVHDLPLLAEMGRAGDFDAVVVVDVAEDEQIRRMTHNRGWTAQDARDRLAAQATRRERLQLATHVIDNSNDMESLHTQVDAIYAQLRALATHMQGD